MKNKQLSLIILSILISTYLILTEIDKRVDVHWLLPKHAECAIKMMYLRDETGKPKPADRMVCHWRVN